MTPHSEIDTVFLDVGNTLISIDFDWVASEVAARGVPATAEELRRAEAAARPSYSQQLFVDGVEPGTDLFRFYLATILERHMAAAELSPASFDVLVTDLRHVLRPDGRASVLWRSVMPGVREALAHMRDLGLRLVVVSNSDGTVARSLEEAGLLACMAAVVDSALAGFEKPDPRIFEAALERSGADRARTIHVGDLYHADVLGARGAGLPAVLLDPYDDWTVEDCVRLPDLPAVAQWLSGSARDGPFSPRRCLQSVRRGDGGERF